MSDLLFSFVHITDTHHTVGSPVLGHFVDIINNETHFPRPTFIIHGGDIINGYHGRTEAHYAEMTEAKAILDTLEAPLLLTCHNHDTVNEAVKGTMFDTVFAHPHMHCVTHKGWVLAIFSGNVETPGAYTEAIPDTPVPDGGWDIWKPDARPILANMLREHSDHHALVFSHRGLGVRKPAPEVKEGDLQGHGYIRPTPDVDAFHKVLRDAGNVVAHYSGHTHVHCREQKEGIEYVTTASLQNYPREFRYIEVYADHLTHRTIGVTPGDPGTYRWGPMTDADHPTPNCYYAGLPTEREFVTRVPALPL